MKISINCIDKELSNKTFKEISEVLDPGDIVSIDSTNLSEIRELSFMYGLSIVDIGDKVVLRKPTIGTIFEQDVALGVFTHREEPYLPGLRRSIAKLFPSVLYTELVQSKNISNNMEDLRQRFAKSNKRYWIFLDDDIEFLHPGTINNAIEYLVQDKHGVVSVYSTFYPHVTNMPDELKSRNTTFAVGYFIGVDSYKLKDVMPDINLPHGNTSVDTSYSAECLMRGYTIGIANELVYHTRKDTKTDWQVVEDTNKYLDNKWGSFYKEHMIYDKNIMEWQ
jgi:hypothetical protein